MSEQDVQPKTADPNLSEMELDRGGRSPGLVRELIELVAENKKWWLLPVIFVLLLLGILILIGGSSAAPFIYTLF